MHSVCYSSHRNLSTRSLERPFQAVLGCSGVDSASPTQSSFRRPQISPQGSSAHSWENHSKATWFVEEDLRFMVVLMGRCREGRGGKRRWEAGGLETVFRTLPRGGNPGGQHTGRSWGRRSTVHQPGVLTKTSLLPSPCRLAITSHVALHHKDAQTPWHGRTWPLGVSGQWESPGWSLSHPDSPFPVPVGWGSHYLLLQNRNDQPGSLAPHLKA